MKDMKKKIEEIQKTFERVKAALDLERKKERLKELEEKAKDPSLWEKKEEAKAVMQELGEIKSEVDEVQGLEEEISTLKELSEEGKFSDELIKEVEGLEKKVSQLELATFLSEKYDRKNAIISIHAGQGGTEAMDWASMLFRMYLRFAERKGFKTSILDMTEGEEAGIKSAALKIEGPFAYGYLKGEAGTHRLVRQSPFNADKLRQTSFALVEVLPELEEIDLPDIKIDKDDLEWQFFRASTQGGQNVQKVSTAVRVIHKPTKIAVTSQAERSQEQNRKIALNLLRGKLWKIEQEKRKGEKERIKGEYKPASWGTQIRSYILHPYKMVKDLRTNVETSDTENVLAGDLDKFIEEELKLS